MRANGPNNKVEDMFHKYNPNKHHRRSIRLKGYDYTSDGAYFVTICVDKGQCVLGDIKDGVVQLTRFGEITWESWLWLETEYPYVQLDESIVMPNHLHGIIIIGKGLGTGGSRSTGGSRTAPTVKRKPLGRLIGAFKTVSTKEINNIRGVDGVRFWQRNYHEHIIRNERALNVIRAYIRNNPLNWELDKLHPEAPPNQFNRIWRDE